MWLNIALGLNNNHHHFAFTFVAGLFLGLAPSAVMETSSTTDLSILPPQDKWVPGDDHVLDHLGAVADGDREPPNGLPPSGGEPLPPSESVDDYRSEAPNTGKPGTFREKQVKVPSFLS